ncbi:hypothetical protein Tco_0558891 [Tanacetum coccineum]
MVALKFAETHNLVAFLSKPEESDGFEQIVDFLNANPINYALTVKPKVYTSCIEQFWTTGKAKTVNGERQLQAKVDGKKVIVTESSIRRDLHLEDAEGTDCLPTATIFKELTRIGAKTTAWNKFSSTMASATIYLATNQKFNFFKYIFDNMVKNLEGGVKFLMYPSDSTEPIAAEAPNEDNVTTTSNDPLLSGEDRLKLNELMDLCTNLQQKVLDLEKAKTAQDSEIASLKKRVKKLEKRHKSRTPRLKRLKKVGRTARIESYEDEGLGGQDDEGRKIADIDVDAEEVEVKKVVSTAEVTTSSATTTTIDELTLAQTLIEIKAAKPKAVTTAGTTTTAVTRPKARGEEEANIALIESWNNVQAMIEAGRLLAERLQAREQEELTNEEKARLFVELLEKRKKHFAALRAQEKRNKPPTKAQKKCTMSTYLKHMAGYKQSQLKNKSFAEIQKLFDKAMTRVNMFVDMDTEMKESSKKAEAEMAQESRSKRACTELEQEVAKKQKIDDDQEEAKMKRHMEIVLNEEEVAVDAIPLATKPPTIMLQSIDREDLETLWKLVKAKHGSTRLEEEYERVLWGDLKVMFEPDVESEVWRNLQGHNVTVLKLFDSCGVHSERFKI